MAEEVVDNENLKKMYEKFKESYVDSDKGDVLKDWIEFSNKISNSTLTIDEYTNLLQNCDNYLLNFLERTSDVYGSSKGGNSDQYMIHMNKGSENKNGNTRTEGKYFISKELTEKNSDDLNAEKKEAEDKFKSYILPLLKKVNEAEDLNQLEKDEDYQKFKAKQILRKIVVLNSLVKNSLVKDKSDFLFIYQNDTIDSLYKEFISKEEKNGNKAKDNYYDMNKEIMKKSKEILGISELNVEEQSCLSSFLWKYVNVKSPVSKEFPNVILYGAPGTGKTYEVESQILFLTKGEDKCFKKVQFHPGFTYEDFIEGIKPVGIENGNIRFEVVNGIFKQFCIDAKKEPNKNFYFIADEINRANLSALFGETLSLLEKDYRQKVSEKDSNGNEKKEYRETKNLRTTVLSNVIKGLPNKQDLAYQIDNDGNVLFGIPDNLYFIGMMNDVDKSIDTFDLALRRRFKWIRKDCDYKVIESCVHKINVDDYVDACKKLNNMITDTFKLDISYQFGHSFFLNINNISKNKEIKDSDMEELFSNYLKPTLTEYLRTFRDESEIEGSIKTAKSIFVLSNKIESSETDPEDEQ